MKKTNKKNRLPVLVSLALLLCCGASWGLTLYGHREDRAGYDILRAQAEENFQKQIYDEALEEYQSCLSVEPEDTEAMARVAEIYARTDQQSNCIVWCERVTRKDPANQKVRLLEAQAYDSQKKVASAISVLEKARTAAKAAGEKPNPDLAAFLRELKGRYDLSYMTLTKVAPWFRNPDGTESATVVEEETLSVYSSAGKKQCSGAFSFLGAAGDEELLYPAREGNQWFFVKEDGSRALVPEGSYTHLGSFSGGYAPATRQDEQGNTVAGYLDREGKEHRFEFQKTCPLVNGRALAQKDGAWFFLGEDLQETDTCPFTDVKTDVYGNALHRGLLIGKVDEGWTLFTEEGTRCGTFAAEDVDIPASEKGFIAFCREGLWGFVRRDGTEVLPPRFEEAHSFSKGMAAVKQGGKWGYIQSDGTFLIEPTFEDAQPLSEAGTAFVKNHAGYSLLTLSRYKS